jgi:hypothetical protein
MQFLQWSLQVDSLKSPVSKEDGASEAKVSAKNNTSVSKSDETEAKIKTQSP